jgi:hypothetical protein
MSDSLRKNSRAPTDYDNSLNREIFYFLLIFLLFSFSTAASLAAPRKWTSQSRAKLNTGLVGRQAFHAEIFI